MTKNTPKNYKDIITEKKAMIELVDRCLSELDNFEKYTLCDMVKIGEHHMKDWDGNLLYKDEDGKRTTEVTDTPMMETDYDYRLPADMDEETQAKYNAMNKLRDILADLI